MKHTKTILLALTAIVFAVFVGVYTQRTAITDYVREAQKPELPAAVTFEETKNEVVEEVEEVEDEEVTQDTDESVRGEQPASDPVVEEVEETEEDLPATFNLAVPFTSQAPHANWDLPYQEACEEASLYMVHLYYEGKPAGQVAADVADAEILNIVEFEKAFFGDYLDTTAEQTAELAEQMYGYTNVELVYNPTIEDIKRHIAAGRPVIVPAAGQQLGNPFFTPPGPLYHMLVVRGYTEKGFITNDPGTRRGEGHVYPYTTLMNAIHDWNDGDVENGQRVVLVVYPAE